MSAKKIDVENPIFWKVSTHLDILFALGLNNVIKLICLKVVEVLDVVFVDFRNCEFSLKSNFFILLQNEFKVVYKVP